MAQHQHHRRDLRAERTQFGMRVRFSSCRPFDAARRRKATDAPSATRTYGSIWAPHGPNPGPAEVKKGCRRSRTDNQARPGQVSPMSSQTEDDRACVGSQSGSQTEQIRPHRDTRRYTPQHCSDRETPHWWTPSDARSRSTDQKVGPDERGIPAVPDELTVRFV
jgi:hypothetical protein